VSIRITNVRMVACSDFHRVVKPAWIFGAKLLCSEDKPGHCHRRLVADYLAQRRPDFLVTRGDSRMYVECDGLFEDRSRTTSDSEACRTDYINAARNPDFMVDVAIEHFGSLRLGWG
jgi:uncharacterized protein (DUF488 family)